MKLPATRKRETLKTRLAHARKLRDSRRKTYREAQSKIRRIERSLYEERKAEAAKLIQTLPKKVAGIHIRWRFDHNDGVYATYHVGGSRYYNLKNAKQAKLAMEKARKNKQVRVADLTVTQLQALLKKKGI